KKSGVKKRNAKSTSAGKKVKSVASGRASTSSSPDKFLREHLLYLLGGGGAHTDVDHALGDWPVQLAGAKVANFPHTPWMLLEHMRIAQWDILEFSRNPRHKSPPWPEGYWPETEMPPNEKAWKDSVRAFKQDLRAMGQLVANPRADLYAKLSWG